MAKNLFIGNLPFDMTDDNMLQIFSAFGQVTTANIVDGKLKTVFFVAIKMLIKNLKI